MGEPSTCFGATSSVKGKAGEHTASLMNASCFLTAEEANVENDKGKIREENESARRPLLPPVQVKRPVLPAPHVYSLVIRPSLKQQR